MWIRKTQRAQARMPSRRAQRLNPRAPIAPQQTVAPQLPGALAAGQDTSPGEEARRAGGFHESSYELQHGLEVSESEWPPELTVPGALGEH